MLSETATIFLPPEPQVPLVCPLLLSTFFGCFLLLDAGAGTCPTPDTGESPTGGGPRPWGGSLSPEHGNASICVLCGHKERGGM